MSAPQSSDPLPRSNRSFRRRALRWLALAAMVTCCVGCDQITKTAAMTHLKGEAPHSYCDGLVRLEYAENPGAFLSLGAEWPPVVRLVVLSMANGLLMAAIGVVLVLRWAMPAWEFVGCALLFAGGIGNLIDRLRFDGLVIDFLNLGIGPLRTGIFNVADMAIMAGAVMLLLANLPAKSAPQVEQA